MRKTLKNKPLTLAEKIIYGHLDDPSLAPVRDAAQRLPCQRVLHPVIFLRAPPRRRRAPLPPPAL